MKHFFWLFAFFQFSQSSTAQTYFQQKVDFDIKVDLNTTNETYKGVAKIHYQNNSPDNLDTLYFHLWANAYASDESAFAKQQLRMGQKKFHFRSLEENGGYKKIEFKDENLAVLAYETHQDQPEIVKLILSEALRPNESIKLVVDFEVKVPPFFSRMGTQDGFFQMTQWFPKPAVYDLEGWHPMPYLDMGEFYSEFGDFKVEIAVPQAYQVAATGAHKKVETGFDNKNRFFFEAENVHDFAWVAFDQFIVERDELRLKNGETVKLYVYRLADSEHWENSLSFLKNAVQFYSSEVGTYPYPQATVVQSPGGTGSGMEYPMLTTIDIDSDEQSVDHVIAHEVGHNWFYGILASNERENPWMDEGMNSYVDHKYNDLYYSKSAYDESIPNFLNADSTRSFLHKTAIWQCKRGRNQKCTSHSQDLTSLNYGFSAYELPAISFAYLESYLGKEIMKLCVQTYYEKWKFKHPQPKDLQNVFEQVADKNLDWFFQGLLDDDGYIDYAIVSVNDDKVVLKNKGQIDIPIKLDYKKDGQWLITEWIEGFSDQKTIELISTDVDEISINGAQPFLDVIPKNNSKKLKGSNLAKLSFPILAKMDDPKTAELFWLPFINVNAHDKLSLGLSLYNAVFPKWTRFNTNLAYSFARKDWLGTARVEQDIYLDSDRFRKIGLGANFRKFTYDIGTTSVGDYDFEHKYWRFAPFVSLFVQPYFTQKKEEWLTFQTVFLNKEVLQRQNEVFSTKKDLQIFHEFSFHRVVKKTINPSNATVSAQMHSYGDSRFLKLSADVFGKLLYREKSAFHYRLFLGYFPINTSRYTNSYNNDLARGSFNLSYNNFGDADFSDFWLGREIQDSWLERQIQTKQGGFKTALLYNNGNLGKSNHAMFALNLKVDIPVPLFRFLPIKPYLDLGSYANGNGDQSVDWKFLYDAGLAMEFLDGAIGIYLPLVQSKEIKQIYQSGNFAQRISFQVNFNRLRPWDLIDRLDL